MSDFEKFNYRVPPQTGYDRLWLWFGLSRASWLTLPRALMHEMPDEWQNRMAALLEEWDATWINPPDLDLHVSVKRSGRYVEMPDELRNYRHPDRAAIARFRAVFVRHEWPEQPLQGNVDDE